MNWVSAYDGVSDPSTFAIYTSDGKIVFDPSLSKGDIKVYSLSYSMNNRTIGLAIFSSGNPEIMVVSKDGRLFQAWAYRSADASYDKKSDLERPLGYIFCRTLIKQH